MKRFYHSLTFRIAGVIVLVEIVALAIAGVVYVNRFSAEVDQRIEERALLPGVLMNAGLLSLDSVADQATMGHLVGEELIAGMIVGVNGNVFYSLQSEYIGQAIGQVPGVDVSLFDPKQPEENLVYGNNILVAVSPILGADKQTPRFFVYVTLETSAAEAAKTEVRYLFVLGSVATVVITSVALLLAFRWAIFDRIAVLLRVLARAAAGDLSARVEGALSQDEIGILQQGANALIAERQQAEQALRQSEERYRSTLENMMEGCQIIGFDWCYLYVNEAAARHGRRMKETLLGHTMMEAYPGIEETEMFGFLRRCMAERTAHHMENTFTYPDGSKGWFDLSIQPVPEGVFILSIDISERKRVEEALRQHREHLEELVAERTAKLQEVNQDLSDFAYVVSHDLKAPLRAVTQLADWIATDYAHALDEQGQEMVSLLIGRTRRMHDLIQGILEYSRIGRVKERDKQVDLNRLVQNVLALLVPPAHIRVTVKSKLPTLVGEQTRLEQVFANLIGNAIKFMDKPEGCVIIDCVDQGHHWLFSVADNGPGVEEKYFAKIFQMFQTLAPRDQVEGTGVGLALVKKIVAASGGRVWVESTVGKGSTFYFTLPKEKGEGDENQ